MHGWSVVVGGERGLQFACGTTERVGEDLRDPARVRISERQVSYEVVPDRRSQFVNPQVLVALRDLAQHGIHETRRAHALFATNEVDGRRDRRVRPDAGPQQLVGTETQYIEDVAIDLGHRTIRGRGDDRVESAERTRGAVGQLRGQRGVTSGDLAFPQ
ncbi:Uncharacterised protein [Mycobacteroides abscessus subsp. abscessus]|nr:Uncharacterised protein [Mycobacteroides abscessus subsp. abscessus]